LRQYQLVTAERELLEKTLQGSVKMLSEILSTLSPQSFNHTQRLREYMVACAKAFNITQTWELEMAASLSQIGLVTVPAKVVEKMHAHQSLSAPENDLLARVPETGFNLLSNIPRLETVAKIVRYQGKNFDGTGFPADEISGANIPIGARILRVLSDLLLMESHKVPKTTALAASPCTASICGTDGRLDIAGTFYLPSTVTLYDRDGTAIDRYEPTADVAHQGLRYEAADAARCVTGGATESPLHPPATTLRIMEAMDEVRRQLGVHFPDK